MMKTEYKVAYSNTHRLSLFYKGRAIKRNNIKDFAHILQPVSMEQPLTVVYNKLLQHILTYYSPS